MPRDIFKLAYNVRMAAGKPDTAEVMLYGEIIPDMPEAWKWSKEDKSAADFDKAIKAVKESGATKLLIRINSPGGVCTEAVAMRGILANAGFEEINIRIEGLCASAATDIATLPGAHVAITEGSEYMIHNPWTFAIGNADDLEHAIERLRNIEKTSRGFYAKKCGQSDEQIKEWMDAETWFTADEAVEYGFCDELIETAKEELPAVACVTSEEMAVMSSLYKAVPDDIGIRLENAIVGPTGIYIEGEYGKEFVVPEEMVVTAETIRCGIPDNSGEPSEINLLQEEDTMDIKNLTMEELREGNPALYEQVRQEAVESERNRQEEIDSLTMPGYEELASKAKADGTSAMDFHKQVIAAMKQKGNDFLAARTAETTPAQQVAGGEPKEQDDEDRKFQEAVKDVAAYAETFSAGQADGMF